MRTCKATDTAQHGFHIVMLWTDREYTSTIVGVYDTNCKLAASKWVKNRLWVAEFMNSTTLYSLFSMGDTSTDLNRRNGVWMWNIETNREARVNLRGAHHMIEYNPLHNTWLTLQQGQAKVWRNGVLGPSVMVDDIWEFTMEGLPVWKWYARHHIPRYTRLHPTNVNPNKDFIHANTLHYDVHEGVVYYNSRHMDTVWKINKTSGECLWAIGRYGDVPMRSLAGAMVPQLFSHAHGLTRTGDHTFVTFDNAAFMGPGYVTQCRGSSKVKEFTWDPVKNQAQVTWEAAFRPGRCRQVQGGVVSLPNGNVLGSFQKGWEVELNRAGQVVWSMQVIGNLTTIPEFPPPHDFNVGSRFLYRPFARLLRAPTCADARMRLSVWNTFRHESTLGGVLTLFSIDPMAVPTGGHRGVLLRRPFDFQPHWLETQLGISVPLSVQQVWVTVENEEGRRSEGLAVAVPQQCR